MSSGGSWELLLRQASAAAEDTGAALLAADGPLHQADALSLVLCRSLEDEVRLRALRLPCSCSLVSKSPSRPVTCLAPSELAAGPQH